MSGTKETDAKIRKGASFTRQIEKFIEGVEERSNVVVRKITFGVLANVVMGSPVDKGRFRGNWQVGLGVRPSSPVEVDDPSGSATLDREGAKIENSQVGGMVYITNTLPYARRLEFGHSAQAPRGMVRVTMRSIGEIIEEAVRSSKK